MREIKFRAWNKSLKAWEDFRTGSFLSDDHDPYIFSMYDPFAKTQMLDVQQYTGLEDKNGKEIYEGDIVRLDDQIGEVEYDRYAFCVKDFYNSSYDTPGDAFSEGLDDVEVIGNIYESPELLK